jgi:hypothetical protein
MEGRRRSELVNFSHGRGASGDIPDQGNMYGVSESLSYEDRAWLKSIEQDIHSAIWIWLLTPTVDNDAPAPIPDPTYDDFLIYLQIRKAVLAQIIRQSEERIVNQTRASASLGAILTLVPVSKESSCSICKADFDELHVNCEVIESPAKLPCDHEFGSRCLETWAGVWEPGTDFDVSWPMCREVFVLVPRDEELVSPRWFRLLRGTWSL